MMFSKSNSSSSRMLKAMIRTTSKSTCSSSWSSYHPGVVAQNVRSVGTFQAERGMTQQFKQSQKQRLFSTMSVDFHDNYYGPMGELFDLKVGEGMNESLIDKTASIRRVFGPSANANGLLTCGGEELARHASFDPDYSRARGWIQNRAIGPAVVSPVLINGLVGALVEAAFPQSVPVAASMHQARPLIVGQEVLASVQVIGVKHFARNGTEVSMKEKDFGRRQDGHEIHLSTQVVRTQDDEIIAEGSHSIWIPGYLSQ